MERSLVPSMDVSKPSTHANLEAAFGGESMANRKYLFFSDVAKQLGHKDLAKLFRDTAAQETEHAFAHFRLLHPELVVSDPEQLSDDDKQAILSRCLELAIEGETYEYTTMYPEFSAQARQDRDSGAEAEFAEQSSESKEHAGLFRTAAKNFGLLRPDRTASRRNLWRCPRSPARQRQCRPGRSTDPGQVDLQGVLDDLRPRRGRSRFRHRRRHPV